MCCIASWNVGTELLAVLELSNEDTGWKGIQEVSYRVSQLRGCMVSHAQLLNNDLLCSPQQGSTAASDNATGKHRQL